MFVEAAEGTIRVVSVEAGQTNGPDTEIRRGVNPGEEVVSEGVFALKSELFR